jgi:hypothetical protein
MGATHRLRALEMRVCRHQVMLEGNCLIDHDLLKRSHRLIEIDDTIHHPQTGCSRDLIVSAATRMKLRRDVTNFLVQQPVDHRVHVFV